MSSLSAIQHKEQGQQMALFSNQSWSTLIMDELAFFCALRKVRNEPIFRFEEFRYFAEQDGIESPTTHKAWGAIPRIAVKQGLIKWTGDHQQAQSLKTHGHYVKTWCAL